MVVIFVFNFVVVVVVVVVVAAAVVVEKKAHADIRYVPHDFIVSGFVALTPVTIASGPTYVLAGTHTSAFHQQILTPDTHRSLLYYGADGI